ncbi:MAG: nucleotidyl transferase AbiEii/AbiGii toxin family protein [Alphaproteobacteria bacterium]|nr:nucleotidyl transferase AbiEii/AbiGii toxin family protein [Alphaproteobacteria bacterium]MBU1279646.1 nucleotidyl transferase AbiEii/AbiGii toxin family protein [Alphaproteobacteria bacterium]MBU1827831.1 nucleotidyl transferase AbiEii/AbiGii toxin family protein [Alphaproteobacteria bacterium]MBU2244046.1 nucleotidyl transferase AbiEii/AbiGii toxin family protein [Alphaproteobacteria bacterium]
MATDERFRQQVDLLIRVLPSVAEENVFALKGGTAINLFVRDLPRLSVDIDLTYLPVKAREESLADIDAALDRISKSISEAVPQTKVVPSRLHNEGIVTRLVVRTPETQIKVEVTPVARGCVFEPRVMQVAPSVEDQFGYAETQVVSFDDLYAGKIVAALDRQHPRDLFDVRDLLRKEGISMSLRQAFLAYIVSHNRPAIEVLAPTRKDIRSDFEENFLGMTTELVELEELVATREEMIEAIVAQMPDEHRAFLVGVERGEIDWNLSGLTDAANLPAIRWKLANLDRLEAERRHRQAEELEGIWR